MPYLTRSFVNAHAHSAKLSKGKKSWNADQIHALTTLCRLDAYQRGYLGCGDSAKGRSPMGLDLGFGFIHCLLSESNLNPPPHSSSLSLSRLLWSNSIFRRGREPKEGPEEKARGGGGDHFILLNMDSQSPKYKEVYALDSLFRLRKHIESFILFFLFYFSFFFLK